MATKKKATKKAVEGVVVKRKRGRPRKVRAEEATLVYTATATTKDKVGNDPVNHPAHYTAGGIECIDALAAATTGLKGLEAICTSNAIKYLWRWKTKGGAQDLRKARWYLERLIAEVEKK